jgi:hypothetical protein
MTLPNEMESRDGPQAPSARPDERDCTLFDHLCTRLFLDQSIDSRTLKIINKISSTTKIHGERETQQLGSQRNAHSVITTAKTRSRLSERACAWRRDDRNHFPWRRAAARFKSPIAICESPALNAQAKGRHGRPPPSSQRPAAHGH